ncbi:hypothetical protein JCM16418A_42570 [Paenibacillus pini]|uniref:Uncharacterized protein n=1 Tax=Paenibacillus pini JCM 16418 TaxID=1236976 RepID=W7Z659_9BACL|nr:hypothetical protein [Paenibacillus pini]GAF09814.1 hypothetical protein JCM16418_3970 [Paenibacillus pini JCM 16418]
MKDNYIHGMREIKADSSLKNAIIQHSLRSRHAQHSRPHPLFKLGIAVISLVCALTLILLAVPDVSVQKHVISGGSSPFGRLAITAYASNGTAIDVEANVEFPLGTYQLVMSSVPGFPIRISAQGADQISLHTSDGEFILWSPTAPKVIYKGQNIQIEPGKTLYWTPLIGKAKSEISEHARIEVTTHNHDQSIQQDIIEIKRDDQYRYTGKWLNSSLNK